MEQTEVVTGPVPVRVRIDLNARSKDGYVLARLSRADGPVFSGDYVVAFEPDDRVAAQARVVRIDDERGLIYLAVDWLSLAEDHVPQRILPQPSSVIGLLANAAERASMRFRVTTRTQAVAFTREPDPQRLREYQSLAIVGPWSGAAA